MPFTGRLGTPDSQLGNIELGASGASGRTSQNLQLRARIQNTGTQGLQLRARIQTTTDQSLQMRANIRGGASLQMRANILGTTDQSLQLKARILSNNQSIALKANIIKFATADLEIDYHVQGPVTSDLLVTFNTPNATRVFQSLQMRANVQPAVTAALSVSFDLCFGLPTPPVVRPTQRTEFRPLRTLAMRAHIRTCTVVLIDGVYTRVCD